MGNWSIGHFITMLVREVLPEEKEQFNALVRHPLQSWEWGEFRRATGREPIRLGAYDPEKKSPVLEAAYQLTVHPIPGFGERKVLYFPRGPLPDETMIGALVKLAAEKNALLVKIDPEIPIPVQAEQLAGAHQEIHDFLVKHGAVKAAPFWFEYSYLLDLAKSDEDLLTAMHAKTRYNLKIAKKHGVEVVEDNSPEAFETYLALMKETTARQHFWAHTENYHRQMWTVLQPAGIARLLTARYRKEVLAAWILFVFHDTLYYPYGASSRNYREAMPVYALMWEAIRYGRKNGCKTFDLWGSLGPEASPKDPWFGFHRFKAGWGGKMVHYLGTYDLVADHRLYSLYNLAGNLRAKYLKIRSYLPHRS